MPYDTLKDLPDSVRDNLPKHAQEIYQAAYIARGINMPMPRIAAATLRARKLPIGWPGLL